MKFPAQGPPCSVARRGAFVLGKILLSLAVVVVVPGTIAKIAVCSAKVLHQQVLAGNALTAARAFPEHLRHVPVARSVR